MSRFYPISLNLNNKLCTVIGGGKIALRKIYGLLECGAIVKVISPTIKVELKHLLKQYSTLSWVNKPYTGKEDLKGASLVFAATDNSFINEKIYNDANALNIFVNIASHGELRDFIVPATFNQGDLQVSISTSGKVPGLSKAIKENLEDQFGDEYATLISILEQVRNAAIMDTDNKITNLSALAEIVQDYHAILNQLCSGEDPNTILEKFNPFCKQNGLSKSCTKATSVTYVK